MKTILVVNDSTPLRAFLEKQISEYGFNVILAINGLDGWSKIRRDEPDLIIMDYFLSRKSSTEILKSIENDPNIHDIPVIMTISKLEKRQIMAIAKLGVKKILGKPVRIDSLLSAIAELLNVPIEMDPTPCILDAHLNDQILFVEIAKGFNREKINLLQYKISELIRLYSVADARILILMTDIDFREEDRIKLDKLMAEALSFVKAADRLRVLTVSQSIRAYIASSTDLAGIEVVATLEEAMDGLFGIEGVESLTAEQDTVQDRFFSAKQVLQREAFQLNFQKEDNGERLKRFGTSVRIAVVDDDMIVREIIKNTFASTGWGIFDFSNGADFIQALKGSSPYDLLFLDLIMPDMNGFTVLQEMKAAEISTPTIILTALTRKESVVKARQFGVSSYLIKPIKPEEILAKAAEILGTDF